MATLFFEGFNIANNDGSPYLDPRYWSRQSSQNPKVVFNNYNYNSSDSIEKPLTHATQGSINISGYILDTVPPQSPTFLQLSGINGLNSDQIFFSFRARHLSFNDKVNSHPYASKFLSFCDGNTESLVVEVVRTLGPSIQGGSWGDFDTNGIGLSIKQSGTQIGLFDLRIGNLQNYTLNSGSTPGHNLLSTQIGHLDGSVLPRFIHIEFLIDRQNNRVGLFIEGVEVLNSLTIFPYDIYASTSTLGNINNIKFYNKGFSQSVVADSESSIAAYNQIGTPATSIDDLVICNNSGNQPNYFIGPRTRIFHMINSNGSLVLDQWSKDFVSGAENSILNTRDGDNSYLYSDTPDQASSFYFNNPKLDGPAFSGYVSDGIGGVRIFNDVRKTFLDTNFVNIFGVGDVNDANNYIEIGNNYTVDRRSYVLKNSFIFDDPISGNPWNSGTFFQEYDTSKYRTSGAWGIKKL